MAREIPIQGSFGYRSLHLDKSENNSLGIGSYGAVYTARCDQLPCAAKVLHPILFSTRDPASRRIVERFEQECRFLSEMRHPNIVQYLGSCLDPESRHPVLLMELMDESLTSFLERPNEPPSLPFHVQVNISLDVAQALVYLHANQILHRDLSSNNVLLIGSSRAKVTDFGMARLAGNQARLTPTFCPGTMVYMSPETLREPPEYTSNLDVFSCGVLHIQIITRKFPDPAPRMRVVEVGGDPRFGATQVHVVVRELERRRSHIDLVDPTHPLVMVALSCLKDEEGQRPSAQQLCSRLSAIKHSPQYATSLQQAQQAVKSHHEVTEAQPTSQREILQRNRELQQQLKESVRAKEREMEGLARNMEQLRLQSERKLQEKEREIHHKEEQVEQLRYELHQIRRDNEHLVATLQNSLEQNDDIRSKDETLQLEERQIQELTRNQLVHKGGSANPKQSLKVKWEEKPNAPFQMFGECSAVQGKFIYCYSWKEDKIMMFNTETGAWTILPQCQKKSFSIAVVKGLLTAIGGQQSNSPTKSLLSLTEPQKWTEQFPAMTYYHNLPAVVCTSTSLIVAGGHGPDEERAPVEVMDTEMHWSTAASLPRPWNQATIVISEDRLYMAGGFENDNKTKSVLTCSVSELLQSTASQHLSLGARLAKAFGAQPSTESRSVWQEVAPLPIYYSSPVIFHGRLLTVGGCDSDRNATTSVQEYDPATNSWKVISDMKIKRFQCFTAVLPDNTLLVVGGIVRTGTYTGSVEIASPV